MVHSRPEAEKACSVPSRLYSNPRCTSPMSRKASDDPSATSAPFTTEPFRKLVALEQRRHSACWEAVGDVSVGDPVQHLREARFVVQFPRDLLRLLQPVHHFLVWLELERGRCPPEDHVTQLLGRRLGDLLQCLVGIV